MIGSFEPVGHISPRPRIDSLDGWKQSPLRADTSPLEGISIHEKNRIWLLIEKAAGGYGAAE